MRLGVEETHFLLLRHDSITTKEDLLLKVPTATDSGDYLRQEIHPRAAYESKDAEGHDVFPRARFDLVAWSLWRRSDVAAALISAPMSTSAH